MIDLTRLEKLIGDGESLECDFKSDRKQLSDNTIYEEIVRWPMPTAAYCSSAWRTTA